ncbi:hypothetical protein ACFQZ2_01030 [Streptomonospora algeriensis]|uniref:Uncharacterized protein n=1 Tax=Streptomonospora algeriensis TaxID=995084 RepID=A0ABW3BDK6_9ACTN
MRQSPCAWALGAAAVTIGLVVADAASTAENAAVPEDIALTSAGAAASATAAPPSGSEPSADSDPAPPAEQGPHAVPLSIRSADTFTENRPNAGVRGPVVVMDAGERTPSERHSPRPAGDPDFTGVRLGPP